MDQSLLPILGDSPIRLLEMSYTTRVVRMFPGKDTISVENALHCLNVEEETLGDVFDGVRLSRRRRLRSRRSLRFVFVPLQVEIVALGGDQRPDYYKIQRILMNAWRGDER